MLLLLLLIALSIPILEIAAIIRVNEAIGAGWTITLLLAASALGLWLLRREGARAVGEFRAAVNRGDWPGDAVAHGAAAVIGGSLLVAPGFVTDVVGLILLMSPVRRVLLAVVRRRATQRAADSAGHWAGRARLRQGQAASGGRAHGPSAAGPRRAAGTSAPPGSGAEILNVEVVEVRRASESSADARDAGSEPTRPQRGTGADASETDAR